MFHIDNVGSPIAERGLRKILVTAKKNGPPDSPDYSPPAAMADTLSLRAGPGHGPLFI